MTRAVFLDRDGTLMEEVHYCKDPADVRAYRIAREALLKLRAAGFRTVIVTNQSAIGRGLMTESDYQQVEAELLRQLGPGVIDATYHCPATPDHQSFRRKPNPGMVLEAAEALNLDLSRSFLVGDQKSDIECGRNAGLYTVLVLTGYGAGQNCAPDYRAKDIGDAVEHILQICV